MAETKKLPVLPLRGMVVFPYMLIHLDVGRPRSMEALEAAMVQERETFLTAQTDPEIEEPEEKDLYPVGTLAEIRQLIKLPDGSIRVLVEGKKRARKVSFAPLEHYDEVEAEICTDPIDSSMGMEALTRAVVHEFEQWVRLSKKIPAETLISVAIIDDAGRLADLIASHLNLKLETRQELLSCIDVRERLEKLYEVIARELEIQKVEQKIGTRVRKQMEKIQKDYYLREQIKAIRKELGDTESTDSTEYREKLEKGEYPDAVKKAIEKELKRLETMGSMSAEVGVIRNYLDWLFDLPWLIETKDTENIAAAKKILDRITTGWRR